MSRAFHAGPAGPACAFLLLCYSLASCAAGPRAQLPAVSATAPPRATWQPTWTPPPVPTAVSSATWVPLPSPAPGSVGGPSEDAIPRLDAGEARDLVASGEAVLVDVRPRALYAGLHAVGAVSMPLDELPDCYEQLPPDVTLIFYCA